MAGGNGTAYGAIRSPIDLEALDKYLHKHLPDFKLPAKVQQFGFGQSNPTFLLSSAALTSRPPLKMGPTPPSAPAILPAPLDPRQEPDPAEDGVPLQLVLRCKPAGPLVSATAHAIEREFRVLEALGREGLPVPRVWSLCTDPKGDGVGSAFYLMSYVEGRIFTDVRMPELGTDEERHQCWRSIIETLASLHRLDPKKIGLADFGSTKPFYPRQIKSLAKVSHAQAAVTDNAGDAVGEIPSIEFLLSWYSAHAPGAKSGDGEDKWEGGLIHGDFKCDNLIFHPTEPRVIGILDWELSTLGHPLSDLANLLQPFAIPSRSEDLPSTGHLIGLRDLSASKLPIPSAQTLTQLYCDAVGRESPIPGWTAAVSFAFFRLAVITQGIASRFARGNASSAQAGTYSQVFPVIGRLALDTIKREEAGASKL